MRGGAHAQPLREHMEGRRVVVVRDQVVRTKPRLEHLEEHRGVGQKGLADITGAGLSYFLLLRVAGRWILPVVCGI